MIFLSGLNKNIIKRKTKMKNCKANNRKKVNENLLKIKGLLYNQLSKISKSNKVSSPS